MAPKPLSVNKPKVVFQNFRSQMEDKLLEVARKYARMKLFGISIENNLRSKHCKSDRENLSDWYAKELCFAAEDLISAMSIDETDGQLLT